ncbi:MAG: NADH:flavin oxidoreductase [Planctomycetota bacterium]
MNFKAPGSFKSPSAFRARLAELDLSIELDDTLEGSAGPLGAPLEVAGLHIPNRFVVHPMEGWDGTRGGSPTTRTFRRWRNFGRSGAGLIWGGEAFAVTAAGRANPHQLHLHEGDVVGDLSRLIDEVRAGRTEMELATDAGPIGLQLTHSGRWSRPDDGPAPQIAAHDPLLDARVGVAADAPLLSDDELQQIRDRYVTAATLAQRAGFDFVDLKACHGYLAHELLGARSRPGRYGGDFEGRTRFLFELIDAVRAACPGLAVGVRISLADVVPHRADPLTREGRPAARSWQHGFGVDHDTPTQFQLDEPMRLLTALVERDVRLVNVTLGSPYYNPHLQRPAAYPPSDGYQPFADPLIHVARHLDVVREAKARVPGVVLVGTGYTYLMEWLPHVAQAEVRAGRVDLIGLGRMMLSYPELPYDVLAGRELARKRICRTFSDCTTAPRHGLASGCYPLDPAYRDAAEATRVKALKDAMRR